MTSHATLWLGAFLAMTCVTSSGANAQTLNEQLAGTTWSLVSNTEEYTDGNRIVWTPDPKGLLIFDKTGAYSLQIGVADRPKVNGNPAENPTGRYIAYFGTYTAADRDITFKITRATFPNWDGTEQKRVVTAIGDQLIYKAAAPIPSAKGPFVPVLIWKREK